MGVKKLVNSPNKTATDSIELNDVCIKSFSPVVQSTIFFLNHFQNDLLVFKLSCENLAGYFSVLHAITIMFAKFLQSLIQIRDL